MRVFGVNVGEDKGAILLTVLLTVAIMSAVAVLIIEQVRYSVQVTINSTSYNQARWYALSTEDWAEQTMQKLASPDNSEDGGEPAATGIKTQLNLRTGKTQISADLLAHQNCFNLNSLVTMGDSGELVPNTETLGQFKRLLVALDFSEDTASQLAASVADWIDADSEALPGGAEDYEYSGLLVPYRTGNIYMADESELRKVKGFTREIYYRVLPSVCALPGNKPNPINLNILSKEESPLTATIFVSGQRQVLVDAIVGARPLGGYTDVEDIWKIPALAGIEIAAAGKAQLSVESRYYLLQTHVSLDEAYVELETLFDSKASDKASFVRRRFGGKL